jgi:epoxyqueuosine reductase
MEKELRCYPQKLFPEAKTAIIFVTNYKQSWKPFRKDAGLIASYARGKKYHNVHKKRLKRFIHWLEEKAGQKNIAKGFSDSTPILEKSLAVKAGLGWFGKNTLLIHRRFGTFTLLSGILSTLDFTGVVTALRLPRCGSCQRCMDACPTQALEAPYKLDANKCLSYHLIESKKKIPPSIHLKNPGYIFGCDICQDVCPHNVRSKLSEHLEFFPDSGLGNYLTFAELENLKHHRQKLHGTPLQRRGVEGLLYTTELLKSTLPVEDI